MDNELCADSSRILEMGQELGHDAPMQTFAILGSHPELSIAELQAVLKATPTHATETVALFDIPSVRLDTLMLRLGGSQKLGTIIGSIEKVQKDDLSSLLAETLLEGSSGDSRISFGFSFYSLDGTPTRGFQSSTQAIGLTTKKIIKSRGRGARFVTSKQPNLSSVVVTKNHLLQEGAEFIFLVSREGILIGKTEAVQDFEDWSARDFGRPGRDARRGMLPPKLARMMINFSGMDPAGKTLLDPFCGSGTVLMEGSLVGCTTLIGSDISPEAVEDTKKNMDWMQTEAQCFVSAAADITQHLSKTSVDLIVTEPFLGKPRTGKEGRSTIEKTISELATLYANSFATCASVLKKNGVCVVAFPVHFIGEQSFPLPIDRILQHAGLKRAPLFDTDLLYHQEGQFVGRNIVRAIQI